MFNAACRASARRAAAPSAWPLTANSSRTLLLLASVRSTHLRRWQSTETASTLPTTPAAPSTSAPNSAAEKARNVIQTIPFVMGPDKGQKTLEIAAHSVLGLKHAFHLIISRVLKKWFGYELATEVKMLAFKPLLIPSWRNDVRLKGRAVLDGVPLTWRISAPDAATPALDLSPLDQLNLNSPWAVEPEPYIASKHTKQHDLEIVALPFTRSPVNLIKDLVKLPRTNRATVGIDIDPAQIKTTLFASYPMYIPVYMGEFVETTGEERRITCVAFATDNNPSFSAYLSFLEEPEWVPGGGAVELIIGGGPENASQSVPKEAMDNFRPLLDAFAASAAKYFSIAEPVKDVGKVMAQPCVMSYSDHAPANKAFMDADEQLSDLKGKYDILVAKTSQASDTTKAVVVTPKGIQFAGAKELRDKMKAEVDAAKEKVAEMRPEWLKPKPAGP